MGYPHPRRLRWVTSPPRAQVQVRMGYPPPEIGYAYALTGYAASGTPLAVSRRRTFLCPHPLMHWDRQEVDLPPPPPPRQYTIECWREVVLFLVSS